MAYEKWKNKLESFDNDVDIELRFSRADREAVTDKAISDLVDFAIGQGYTDNQITTALRDLLQTFGIEWFLYERVGHPALATAIAADATLPWLDLDASGLTIRQRLINRFS